MLKIPNNVCIKPRIDYRHIDGVLLLDKPTGLTSNAALQVSRRLFLAKKAGHTGSLDPLATGVLPICFGEATKFSSYLLHADKSYEATLQFGITTTTGDSEGAILSRRSVNFDKEMLCKALLSYSGVIRQIPPMYSALKHQGQPLYQYARSGLTVERSARTVIVHRIDLIDYQKDKARLAIVCSKGTYIRTLAEDIGATLNCGAHLIALRRTVVGDFGLNHAISLERLQSLSHERLLQQLIPIESLVKDLPSVVLDKSSALHFKQGQSVSLSSENNGIIGKYRVYGQRPSSDEFIGVGEIRVLGSIAPVRLLSSHQSVES